MSDDKSNATLKPKQVDVLDASGNYIRTYSEELHGKDFAEKAKGFAKKKHGRLAN